MPDLVMVAISRATDLLELERTLLDCAHLDPDRLTIIERPSSSAAAARSRVHFIPSALRQVASGSDGTNVPGMSAMRTLSGYSPDENAVDHLPDIGISQSRALYYNIAIEEGRSVVVYKASSEEQDAVEHVMRDCGLLRVRSFVTGNPRP